MLIRFFFLLRGHGLAVSPTEFLALLQALEHHVAGLSVDAFYTLARTVLVKDERHFDRFDRAFGDYMSGVERAAEAVGIKDLPSDWLRAEAEKLFGADRLEAMDWDELMDTLRKRLEEQSGRHSGGDKWVGTAGRSPYGAYGDNPAGVRIGQDGSRRRSAVKVWDRREFRNVADDVELGTRNLQVALRKLRRFARDGAARFDLDTTIDATARNAGLLDVRYAPERRNAVKVLLFLDVGGSMDEHVRQVEQLFSAARSEFKYLEHFYFHNCLYESVWRDNRRRGERTPLPEVLRRFGDDCRVVLVGDASMSPYELTHRGGSVEHLNEEPGQIWLQRLLDRYPYAAWLNPTPQPQWGYTHSIELLQNQLHGRMYPLTPAGLDDAIGALQRRHAAPSR